MTFCKIKSHVVQHPKQELLTFIRKAFESTTPGDSASCAWSPLSLFQLLKAAEATRAGFPSQYSDVVFVRRTKCLLQKRI